MDENKHPQIGHETTDIHISSVVKAGWGLVLVVVVSGVLLYGFYRFLQYREAPEAAKEINPVEVFPQPQLQKTPVEDLKEIRDAEDESLATYGWVDQQNGVVRIPISRAIELLAQRGLPARKQAPATSAVSIPKDSGLGVAQ